MEKPFDFDNLPPELTAVISTVLQWRCARDLGHDAIADQHLILLEESSIMLRDWSVHQVELRMDALSREVGNVEVEFEDLQVMKERGERRGRIAKGKLSLVPEE